VTVKEMAPRLWPGATFVIAATGPSFRVEDADRACRSEVRPRFIAINEAALALPAADVAYAYHVEFWDKHDGLPDFAGIKFSADPKVAKRYPDVRVLEFTGESGFEPEPSGLRHGRNSGHAAINLAVHLGAKRIVLLGYDMKKDGERIHYYPDAPKAKRDQHIFDQWLRHLASLEQPLAQRGIQVINCSRETALTTFPRQTIEEVFP
jgi:hypothetical protein